MVALRRPVPAVVLEAEHLSLVDGGRDVTNRETMADIGDARAASCSCCSRPATISVACTLYSRPSCFGFSRSAWLLRWAAELVLRSDYLAGRPLQNRGKVGLVECGPNFCYTRVRGYCVSTRRQIQLHSYLPFFNFVILPHDFKMNNQFTPTPLCDVNGVKYNAKRQSCPCDFSPNVTLSL
jgi:hypothetical protein